MSYSNLFDIQVQLIVDEVAALYARGYAYREMELFGEQEGICDFIEDNLDRFNAHPDIKSYRPFRLARWSQGSGPIMFSRQPSPSVALPL